MVDQISTFIVGEVILENQQDEWAEGKSVTLVSETDKQNTKTHYFGDFEFEGLKSDKAFVVKIEHKGYSPREFNIKTWVDINLGEIL